MSIEVQNGNIAKPVLSAALSFSDMQLVSHSLGIDLFKSVMSFKLKDKKLPKTFYRNYYNASKRQAEIAGIYDLIKLGYMARGNPEYYYVTEKGIEQFRLQFSEMAIYKKKQEVDIDNLKHRINFYCSFYNYKFCDDNSRHVIDAYQNYWVKKFRVSHTTEDVIKRFRLELKRFFNPKQDVA
jgi:hypothetical protein